jgi:hypothetical protein
VIDAAVLTLKRIAIELSPTFTGIGVIFYDDLSGLPHLQLCGGPLHVPPSEMFTGDLANALQCLAQQASPWHDGFHFVKASDFRLTHIAQFISPPIPVDLVEVVTGKGARFMSAFLSSLIPGIACVGMVSHDGQASLFEHGVLVQLNFQ